MKLRTYGVYDGVQKEYVRTFTATNDVDAERAAKYIVREKGFDDIAGKDYTIAYLFTMDTESGVIVDNVIAPILSLATYIEERKNETFEMISKQKLFDEAFVKDLKAVLLNEVKQNVGKTKQQKAS